MTQAEPHPSKKPTSGQPDRVMSVLPVEQLLRSCHPAVFDVRLVVRSRQPVMILLRRCGPSWGDVMGHGTRWSCRLTSRSGAVPGHGHGRGGRALLVGLVVVALCLAAGCATGVRQGAQKPLPASYQARASRSSAAVLYLRGGDQLVIPAGALRAGSLVSAVYGRVPAGSWGGTTPLDPPVHFTVSPAQRFQKPLLLESSIGSNAELTAARFGYYRVVTLDQRTHRWVEVASSYDPATRMLVTQLWHFSWWGKVQESEHDAQIAAQCLEQSIGIGTPTQIVVKFLRCLASEGLTELESGIETRILSDLLPKNCIGALTQAGILSAGSGPAGVITSVLGGIFTQQACQGSAGESGLPAPAVSKVSPSSGPAQGGTEVTITGWMFATATAVMFGDVPQPEFDIKLNSNSTITAASPAQDAGTVDVRVIDGGGTSPITRADRFTYTGTVPTPQPAQSTTSPPTSISAPTGGNGSWTATEAPLPAGGYDAVLASVTCNSSTCIAAGSYTDAAGDQQVLMESGSGSSWAAAGVPFPTSGTISGENGPSSVSCATSSTCVAVGTYMDSNSGLHGLLIIGSGSSWTATQPPLPANADQTGSVELRSVTCPSPTQCEAVGWYDDSAGNMEGLVLSGVGASWHAMEVPLPADASTTLPNAALSSVACSSATSCIAVGSYQNSSGNTSGMLLTGAGTSWTITEVPLPAGSSGYDEGQVACSSSQCAAFVGYNDSSGLQQGTLITEAGGSWTASQTPIPPNGPSGDQKELISFGCTLASSCTALGAYGDDSGDPQVMVLTDAAGSWSTAAVTLPAGVSPSWVSGPQPGAVACPSSTDCVIAGGYTASGLLISGSGSSWTATQVPTSAGTSNPVVFGVACQSATTCVAVGTYNDSEGLLATGNP
jgi:hypothetical protein